MIIDTTLTNTCQLIVQEGAVNNHVQQPPSIGFRAMDPRKMQPMGAYPIPVCYRFLDFHVLGNRLSHTLLPRISYHHVAINACEINRSGFVPATPVCRSTMSTVLLHPNRRCHFAPSKSDSSTSFHSRQRSHKKRPEYRCCHRIVSMISLGCSCPRMTLR